VGSALSENALIFFLNQVNFSGLQTPTVPNKRFSGMLHLFDLPRKPFPLDTVSARYDRQSWSQAVQTPHACSRGELQELMATARLDAAEDILAAVSDHTSAIPDSARCPNRTRKHSLSCACPITTTGLRCRITLCPRPNQVTVRSGITLSVARHTKQDS
jgi:hypothetical protein